MMYCCSFSYFHILYQHTTYYLYGRSLPVQKTYLFLLFQVEPHTEREVPALAEWITTFLADNVSMVASQRARNKLILSVSWRL